MLNRCEFIGNLGRDPEMRRTSSGKAVANLSVGVGRKYKDDKGRPQEKTEWVRCIIWGNSKGDGLAGVAEKYLRKGSKVFIAGRMATKKWQDKATGQDKYSTEIVVNELEMLDSKNEANEGASSSNGSQQAPSPSMDDFEDEIPF